jgi:outer membrane cobalamin receptor
MIQDTLGTELSTVHELQWNGRNISEQKMRGFVDANLEVKYQYNQQIAAWARVYNTVAQRYQIWNGYDQQRTLFQLGAALSF